MGSHISGEDMTPIHGMSALAALCLMQAPLLPGAHAAPASQAALLSEARVTRAQANSMALAKVPNGTVKSSELEREHGRLVWSLDIAEPSKRGVKEIQIDAKSGKIVLMKIESEAQEAHEAKTELGEAK
jgi:hypothetical protein